MTFTGVASVASVAYVASVAAVEAVASVEPFLFIFYLEIETKMSLQTHTRPVESRTFTKEPTLEKNCVKKEESSFSIKARVVPVEEMDKQKTIVQSSKIKTLKKLYGF